MAVSRSERRRDRRERVAEAFEGEQLDQALDLLELFELAWHDCYSEITPPDAVIEDVLILSVGDLGRLISAVHLALMDWRDTRVAADNLRA